MMCQHQKRMALRAFAFLDCNHMRHVGGVIQDSQLHEQARTWAVGLGQSRAVAEKASHSCACFRASLASVKAMGWLQGQNIEAHAEPFSYGKAVLCSGIHQGQD